MSALDTGPISMAVLLQQKALAPLGEAARDTLERVCSLEVEAYKEADVREEIITPLLGVLGYDKKSYFSIEREKEIKLAGSNRFLDYNMTLWSENFWVMEAKRPGRQGASFGHRAVEQAVLYAAHPEINAALVVLCDGYQIAVFDREEDLSDPVFSVQVSDLVSDIDALRALLSPWQVWLFEKRRVVRYLDKAFRREFNMGRVEELRTVINNRLDAQRARVVKNMRGVVALGDDGDEVAELLKGSDAVGLVEAALFLSYSRNATAALADTLVGHYGGDAFGLLYRMLPESPRDMNDQYCAHALKFLVRLRESSATVPWIPSWLGGGRDLDSAIKTMIELCLSYFEFDAARRGVLLMATGLRRVFKATMVVDEQVWRAGEAMHGLTRFLAPEDEWPQVLSTPARQNVQRLDDMVCLWMARAVRALSDGHGALKPQLLRLALEDLWRSELAIVEGVPSYRELLDERGLGEIHPTEDIGVRFDYLGHMAICMLEDHANWKDYVLEHHEEDLKVVSELGSWQAGEWLGEDRDARRRPSESLLAERFFYGDTGVVRRLLRAYASRE